MRSTSRWSSWWTHPDSCREPEEEKNGIIKRGGRFLYAVVEADVPKVTITIRKSYGGAYA